jgi:chromosomal replication initiator protein
MSHDGDLVTAQWQRVRTRLREEFGEAAYRSWLCSLTLAEVAESSVKIEVPTRFLRDWVMAHYVDRIRALWIGENRAISRIDVVVGEQRRVEKVEPVPADFPESREPPRAPAYVNAAPTIEGESDREISAPLDARFTFENFIVGKPNELAHAAARRVAESAVSGNRAAPFNPLFLYGGVGLGKTHLMHAIAWHIRRHDPNRRVIYLSAEKFMYQFIKALRFKDTMSFKEQFRSVDVLMIDDVQFISGKDSTQEEFFHTFNALVDQNRQVVISADKSPSDLEGMEDRMKSRLGWGLVADIHPTTYELRLGILQAKAEQRHAEIPPKVLEFLAHKITSNVRELEGALTRITAHAQLVGRSITLESAQFNIRLADMHSARRARAVARPRQVAMYLCKQLTPRSLPEIGRKFGGRDHTTVMHAVRKVEELSASDRALAEDIELLRRMLET